MHLNGANSMAISGSALETHWLALDGPPMHNELRKQSSHLIESPFPAGKLFPQSARVVA